ALALGGCAHGGAAPTRAEPGAPRPSVVWLNASDPLPQLPRYEDLTPQHLAAYDHGTFVVAFWGPAATSTLIAFDEPWRETWRVTLDGTVNGVAQLPDGHLIVGTTARHQQRERAALT